MASIDASCLWRAQDQPELDANYVYAGVHADGPTRVLCFSNTRDQYTRGTNEESIALLTTKLQRLEERIRVRCPTAAGAACHTARQAAACAWEGQQGVQPNLVPES